MSDEQRFPWRQVGIALTLLPLSLAVSIGLALAFGPQPNLIEGILYICSPLVAIAGAIWALAIVVRHFWPKQGAWVVPAITLLLITGGVFFFWFAFTPAENGGGYFSDGHDAPPANR
jgi:hypothetical protein